jgi:general secretion pathway protein G
MEHDGRQRNAESQGRGDLVTGVKVPGRRVPFSSARGFTLIELVMTITVMTILTLGVIPLMKISVKRQKEQQLRDSLRQMRIAIDEFHRDTVGMQATGIEGGIRPQQQRPQAAIDPRSRVVISDATIFGVDNPDRYPPDLEILVSGVNVIPRGGSGIGGQGLQSTGTQTGDTTSVLDSQLSTKKKVYLRAIPIDPITGKADWELRSCYDAADAGSWGGENVFDVRSKSKETALNGEKYSDW